MNQLVILQPDTAIRAKVITVRTEARTIDGIGKALLIKQLKAKLRSGRIVKFAYLKSNGDVRIAYGTTHPDFIRDKVCGWGESRENFAVTAYYDLEKGGMEKFPVGESDRGLLGPQRFCRNYAAIPLSECCSSENNFLFLWCLTPNRVRQTYWKVFSHCPSKKMWQFSIAKDNEQHSFLV